MLNRKNKKGFTLAELLIVVAIIAILVAIAVPIFVGSLKDAEEATKNANIRAVRSAAAVAILKDAKYEEHKVNGWTATACITKNGEIKGLTITKSEEGTTDSITKCVEHNESGTTEQKCTCADKGTDACNCEYIVTVFVSALDLDSVGEAIKA